MPALPVGNLFISYRRAQHQAVDALRQLLESHNIQVWLDRTELKPLDEFSQPTCDGMAGSHAVLIWWSFDYADSNFCLQELRLAWQYARRRSHLVGDRVWVVNPEATAGHIFAGDLGRQNYLTPPPQAKAEQTVWADRLSSRLALLVPSGPLSDERHALSRPPMHGLPLPRPLVGRGADLLRIHTELFPAAVASTAAIAAVQLHGLAGIGKSALAAAYAESFALAFPGGVWWFNMAAWRSAAFASVDEAGEAWLHALNHALKLDTTGLRAQLTQDNCGHPAPFSEVRRRIAGLLSKTSEPYLWVLDNLPVVHAQDLRDDIVALVTAPATHGRTLITSRDARPLRMATALRLPALPDSAAQALLQSYLLPAQQAAQCAAAAALVSRVGAHTLALVLFGQRARMQPGHYQRLLAQVNELGVLARLEKLHEKQSPEMESLSPSVLAALQWSIAPLDKHARRLLVLLSTCAPYLAIPADLAEEAFGGDALGDDFADALATLAGASLVESLDVGQHLITVHELVASAALKGLRRKPVRERAAMADALIGRFSVVDDNDAAFVKLNAELPHAEKLVIAVDDTRAVRLATALSRYYAASGQPSEAVEAASLAVGRAETDEGADARDRQRAQLALSCAKADSGDLSLALRMQQALSTAAVSTFGETDADTLTVFSHLAATLCKLHRHTEAEAMQRRLLATARQQHAGHHRHIVSASGSLASTLYYQGKFDEARDLQLETHALAVELDGADGADALILMGNLAAAELALGNAQEAMRLQHAALQAAQKVYAAGHPTLRIQLMTLADASAEAGDLRSACELYQQALSAATQTLGAVHPDSIALLGRLVVAQAASGQLQAALPLLNDFLAKVESVIGAAHPQVLDAIETLAAGLHALQQSIGPLARLLKQVLDARCRDLGPAHLETIRATSNVALALSADGRWHEALPFRQLAADRLVQALGDAHPDTGTAFVELALVLQKVAQPEAASMAQAAAEACFERFFRRRTAH